MSIPLQEPPTTSIQIATAAPRPIRRGVFMAFFLVVATMAAVIAGLTTALLKGQGMEVLTASGATFCSAFGLSVTSYLFLEKNS
ncbi:hypothetical protein DFJ67_1927 [Asanoa ferruginea]|uniref:Uncharacterized protein n=1 Tax=Asanoa ferruginea TaxID=53367 RepID=A0A3D9ZJ85_9ACTN|nr:hypothetical protein [Asanoa ferruginea]REF95963.1 hypothetical protein DFJ67_1927 [Asanoa ferruginea]GIF52468.1 hypothetical protein Afe04nite_70070 [Asanoa ferruginea]